MCLIPVVGNELFECTDYCGEGQQACFPYLGGKGEAVDNQAALLLQDFVKRISGASLPVVNDKSPRKGDIVIGGNDVSGLTEDGFRLKTDNGIVLSAVVVIKEISMV